MLTARYMDIGTVQTDIEQTVRHTISKDSHCFTEKRQTDVMNLGGKARSVGLETKEIWTVVYTGVLRWSSITLASS